MQICVVSRRASALRVALFVVAWTALVAGSSVARADRPPAMSPRTIALPGGPASMKGLGESFSPNLSTGAGSFAIPLDLPPGLGRPSLALRYTSGRGRSELGASFHLPMLAIYRTKDKGAPAFDESDRFAVAGPELNDELVLVNADKRYYRLKNEGPLALFVRDAARDAWTIRFANGGTAVLGIDEGSRQYSVRGVARWLVKTVTDASGVRTEHEYVTDKGYVYPSAIRYQLQAPGYEDRVDFVYEVRGDPFTDYGYGSAITCAQRLARIEASAGCGLGCRRVVRTYTLGYERTSQSFLTSLTAAGEGGADTLPTIQFAYVARSSALGATRTMPQSVPLDLVESGRAQIDDVTGDGLPDLLVGTARNYVYYENKGGTVWSDAIALGRSPDVSLDDNDNGVALADVNGDGFRDVVRSTPSGYAYFAGGNVVAGRLQAFLPAAPIAYGPGSPMWSDRTLRLADLNFDGRTDMMRVEGARAYDDLNVRDASGERMKASAGSDLPLDVARFFNDPQLQMLDFNGDGAQDFVKNDISWGDSRLRVFYGLGGARFTEAKTVTAPKGNPGDFLFGDINNDGYVDLVRYSGQQIVYWLGAGDERWIGPFGPLTAWSAPARADCRSVQLLDMDGSGTNDLVLLTKANRVVYVNLFTSPFVGLLSRIDNGIGLVTSIAYRSSSDYAAAAKQTGTPWRTTLPRAIAAVSEQTVTDSLDLVGLPATVRHTTYEYADGYFDGREREFRGFGYVRVTEDGDAHAETRVTETWMHLGIDPDTGADQEILKGKPYRRLVRNGAGELYSSEETTWQARWLCAEDAPETHDFLPSCAAFPQRDKAKDSLVALATQAWVLDGSWEKTTTPRYTLEAFAYDGWGHVTQQSSYGEVAFAAPRSPGDPVDVASLDLQIGDDEVVSATTFINDTNAWLVGLPARRETRDARTMAAIAVSETRYDGDPFLGLPAGSATRGLVTRESVYLAEEQRWIDSVRYARNALGMVTDSLDANGNHAALSYDAETQSLVTREAIDAGESIVAFGAKYDAAFGVMTESVDPNGNVTRYTYDTLGRIRSVIDPDSSIDVPSAKYAYAFGSSTSPVSLVVEEQLVDRAARSYQTTWRYSDGAGETRLTKTQDDAGEGYVASGYTVKTSLGTSALAFRDYATSALGLDMPPANAPHTEQLSDALGRTTRVYPSAASPTFTLTTYLPFERRTFDEEDTLEGTWLYPAIERTDGQGRLRELVRYNDYAASDGATRARKELRWSYRYDARGLLAGWSDPNGNLREYAYDSLARVTDVRDPNLGPVRFAYDDAGNVRRRTDALGQTRTSTYGPANRLLTVALQHDAHGRPDYTYAYHYDRAKPGGPLPDASNLMGRLAWIDFPTGDTHLTYDRLGRLTSEITSLWDPARSPFEQQARDAFRNDHEYNAKGQRIRTRLPGARSFATTYGTRGLALSVTGAWGGGLHPLVTAMSYDAERKVRRTVAANGTAACAWYTDRAEVAAVASGASATVSCDANPLAPIAGAFQHLSYERTPARSIRRIFDRSTEGALPRLDAEYTYDRLQELTSSRTARGTETFDYDAIQNMVRHTSTAPGPRSVLGELRYGEGAGPNMLTSGGGGAFKYDGVGAMKAYRGYDLELDVEGRLVTARKKDGVAVRYFYDAQGDRRITIVERPGEAPKVSRFVFDQYQIKDGEEIWEVSAGRVGVEIHKPKAGAESVQFAYADHLTGTTHTADANGTLLGFQQFGPYGELEARIGDAPLRGFAHALNEPEEDLGLLRFGARYYAPALARWISADAAIGEAPTKNVERPLEANLFGYARNNPVMFTDPTGRWSSKGASVFAEDVHDMAVVNVLSKQVTPEQLVILRDQQDVVDKDQAPTDQPKHAMNGDGQDRKKSIAQANKFVKDNLTAAKKDIAKNKADPKSTAGFDALGKAIHTLQDGTSPAHKPFQTYYDKDLVDHISRENHYPKAGSDDRKNLEAATQWGYDIANGKAPMPKNFFDPDTGELLIPAKYLKDASPTPAPTTPAPKPKEKK
jgi:RHS repeat-associated protein